MLSSYKTASVTPQLCRGTHTHTPHMPTHAYILSSIQKEYQSDRVLYLCFVSLAKYGFGSIKSI